MTDDLDTLRAALKGAPRRPTRSPAPATSPLRWKTSTGSKPHPPPRVRRTIPHSRRVS